MYMSAFTDSFISTSDLQKNTKKCFEWLDRIKKKVILSNNKPRAILISIDEYERLSHLSSVIPSVVPYDDELLAIKSYEKREKEWKTEFVEAFSFLESLN